MSNDEIIDNLYRISYLHEELKKKENYCREIHEHIEEMKKLYDRYQKVQKRMDKPSRYKVKLFLGTNDDISEIFFVIWLSGLLFVAVPALLIGLVLCAFEQEIGFAIIFFCIIYTPVLIVIYNLAFWYFHRNDDINEQQRINNVFYSYYTKASKSDLYKIVVDTYENGYESSDSYKNLRKKIEHTYELERELINKIYSSTGILIEGYEASSIARIMYENNTDLQTAQTMSDRESEEMIREVNRRLEEIKRQDELDLKRRNERIFGFSSSNIDNCNTCDSSNLESDVHTPSVDDFIDEDENYYDPEIDCFKYSDGRYYRKGEYIQDEDGNYYKAFEEPFRNWDGQYVTKGDTYKTKDGRYHIY